MWDLAHIESDKEDKTNFTSPPVDTLKLYCATVMFTKFVCALLNFCAHEFPSKYETQQPRKTITE